MRLSRATCTMAEVPLPTPTQVPVPSTDIRNAVFAGAKLDEEVTGTGEFYTDRLGVKRLTNTGRNNQFDAAQLDRANRFEQFLLSSGYVFLGDYEDGPFQFSARNQYIRYNNQYYRLNAATDVGFTTTGTDAASFANDVFHLVLMDSDVLRQELANSGGAGMLGTAEGITVEESLSKSSDITTLDLLGIITDGSTDQADLFQLKCDQIASGGSLKIIDGKGKIIILSKPISIDLTFVGLRNIIFSWPNPSYVEGVHTFAMSIYASPIVPSLVEGKNTRVVFERITLVGPGVRYSGTFDGLLINPSAYSKDISNTTLDKVTIRKFGAGLGLGSNAYLMIFQALNIYNCATCIVDTVWAGIESVITNAGENIRFSECTFANSDSLARIYGMESYMSFDKCSFDYTGGDSTKNLDQWELKKQAIVLNYSNCHFESGNVSDGVKGIYFHCFSGGKVNIRGGVFQFGNTTYNDISYFFYTEDARGDFSIEDTFIFGRGVKEFSNNGLRKFMPSVNQGTSNVSPKIQKYNWLLFDPDFSTGQIYDNWHVSGVQTSRLVSDQLVASLSTTTDANGITVPALKLTRPLGSNNSLAFLYVKKPRNHFRGTASLIIRAETDLSLSTPLAISVGMIKSMGTEGAYGRPTQDVILNTQTLSLSQIPAIPTEYLTGGTVDFDPSYINYDYLRIAINMNGMSTNPLYILSLRFDTPM